MEFLRLLRHWVVCRGIYRRQTAWLVRDDALLCEMAGITFWLQCERCGCWRRGTGQYVQELVASARGMRRSGDA